MIEQMIEQTLHDLCKQKYPNLYDAIKTLVEAGQTPEQIEARLRKNVPYFSGSSTENIVFYTASVIRRQT